jgi:hypothetical protein
MAAAFERPLWAAPRKLAERALPVGDDASVALADISTGVKALAGMLTDQSPAVLVRDFKSDETYIITRRDVIRALS